ncbi:hypothetical protein AX16_007813 [Volvariella volvacea WC 439]|nr:hypothetical protein AX16_007813 [Volvariella volvacea WC 439]
MASTVDQVDDAQLTVAQIDEEVARLTLRCCHLKSLRNTHVPISRLPPELLLKIFTAYKHQVEVDYKESKAQARPDPSFDNPWIRPQVQSLPNPWHHTYAWIAVSHVCRRWRDVTLRSPSFWSTIYMPSEFTSLDWLDVLFERSRSSTLSTLSLQLTVCKDRGEDLDLSSLARLLCYSDEPGATGLGGALRPVRRLELSFCAESQNHVLVPFHLSTTSAVPILVDTVSPRGRVGFNALQDVTIMYESGLHHPAHLILSQFPKDGPSNVRSFTLKSRGLSDYNLLWRQNYPRMTRDGFLLALTSFKQLRHLTLAKTLIDLEEDARSGMTPSLTFPQLQTLTLHKNPVRLSADFLSTLVIPPTTRIDFVSKVVEEEGTLVDLFKSLSCSFSHDLQPSSQSDPTPLRAARGSRTASPWADAAQQAAAGDDLGTELAIHQSTSDALALAVTLDPHRRDPIMDRSDIYNSDSERQSINIRFMSLMNVNNSQVLFEGIAQHIQPLTCPNRESYYRDEQKQHRHRYICLSYWQEEFSDDIVRAFSGYRGLDSIYITPRTWFLPALSTGLPNCGCVRNPYDFSPVTPGSNNQPELQQERDRSSGPCRQCRALLGSSYFPELRTLTIVGPVTGSPELEEWVGDEELEALRRVLWYFDLAGRRLERLVFRRWGGVQVEVWEGLCDEVLCE